LSACGGGSPEPSPAVPAPVPAPNPEPAPTPPPAGTLSARAAVGDQLFHEPRLSASGRLACASCHQTARGHADAEGTFLPLGGERLDQQGLRSTPSARYLDQAGAFRINGQGQPVGGLMWDGRFNSRSDQVAGPLFNAKEMANASLADFGARLRSTAAWNALRAAYGLPANASDAELLAATQDAIARYQAEDEEFHAFSSKFDRVQAGQAQFTATEQRGLDLFNDPHRGNCASCHSSRPPAGAAGGRALFTDFSYHALGVPRNRSQATADPAFFDLGLCARPELANRADFCGKFRTPTLRNIALTAPYFHNARFATLDEVLSFYATRDSQPERWYPLVDGELRRFDDLPLAFQANIERRAPFGAAAGGRPRLTAQDIADLAAFLRTLSDE